MASVGMDIARRRKWITSLVAGALGFTVLTASWAYWRSMNRRGKTLSVPQTLPANVHQQLSGYSFTRSEGVRRIFSVHAARTVVFKQGGTTVLEDVFVEVFGPAGSRRDILRTGRCEYNAQSGDLFSPGKVALELNTELGGSPEAGLKGRHPLFLETSRVSFRQQGSLVVTNQMVQFRFGPASGSGRGMTYATKGGWMEVKKDIAVELRLRGAQTQPPLRLSASRLRYEPSRGQSAEVRLSGPLEVTQGNRRLVANGGTIILDARNRITQALLEGGVRASESSGAGMLAGSAERIRADFDPTGGHMRLLVGEGNVQIHSRRRNSVNHLEGQHLEVTFAGPHLQPLEGSASGKVRLILESFAPTTPGSPRRAAGSSLSAATKKTLTADQLQVAFQPEGRSLKAAQTIGPGKLVLVPPNPEVGERVITAGLFLMGFDSRSRLETLRGYSGTEIVFQPSLHALPGSAPQVTSSERLEATFDPATETLQTLEQAGAFRFLEGDRQAKAERARYNSQTEVLTLMGQPEVGDASTRTRAERILFDLRSDTVEGVGDVQSTHFENTSQSQANSPGSAKAGAADPTNVLAERMLAQRRSQYVHYEGHVRAWHGYDVVESSSLDVYRTERRVRSGSRVLTSHLQPAVLLPAAPPGSSLKRETQPVTIRADGLDYFDREQKATYRGNVQLQAENTRLASDRLDVYFSQAVNPGASEVERAVADGHVTIVQPARRASGEHVEYYAGTGKIVLTGGPPTLYDLERGFVTGQSLTFSVHDDRIFVDGGKQSPSLSKRRISR